MHNVVEGIQTTRAAVELGEEYGVELPITEAIYKILFEDMSPLCLLYTSPSPRD